MPAGIPRESPSCPRFGNQLHERLEFSFLSRRAGRLMASVGLNDLSTSPPNSGKEGFR